MQQTIEALKRLFQNSTEGFVLADERGQIVYVNPATCRMFEYSEADLIGGNIRTLANFHDRDRHDGYLDAYKKTGSSKIINQGRKVKARRKDGTEFNVLLNISTVEYSGKKYFAGTLRNLQDVELEKSKTEALAVQLQEALGELKVKNQDLEEAQRMTEDELLKEVQRNAELQKGKGQVTISKIAVYGMLAICLTPGIILLVQIFISAYMANTNNPVTFDDLKAWDVFENFGIYALGSLGGLLVGFFGAKSFQGGEGRTAVRVNTPTPTAPTPPKT